MAPLTRTGACSLAALTIHYSCISFLMHVSMTRKVEKRYSAAAAVVMAEVLKILVCTAVALFSGELVPRAVELRQEKARTMELSERVASATMEKPTAFHSGEGPSHHSLDDGSTSAHTTVDASGKPGLPLAVSSPFPDAPPDTSDPDFGKAGLSFASRTSQYSLTGLVRRDILDSVLWYVLVRERVFGTGWWKVAVPACLFVIQSNLAYMAARNLPVVVYQLAFQLKIPATALFSVILLGRSLKPAQWISLFTLTLGVGLMQVDQSKASSGRDDAASMRAALGLTAVILSCCSSGFASCYFEKMLKSNTVRTDRPSSLWVRNIQLSMFGLALGIPIAVSQMDPSASTTLNPLLFMNSFLSGFDGMAWTVVLLQASGGLLGALVMQFADNIAKCFATSLSVVITFIISASLLSYQITGVVVLGTTLVLASTWLYSTAPNMPRPVRESAFLERRPDCPHISIEVPKC